MKSFVHKSIEHKLLWKVTKAKLIYMKGECISHLATVAPLTVVTVAAVLSRSSSLSCALAAAAATAACRRIRLRVDVTCLGSGWRFGGGLGASRFRPALQRDTFLMMLDLAHSRRG